MHLRSSDVRHGTNAPTIAARATAGLYGLGVLALLAALVAIAVDEAASYPGVHAAGAMLAGVMGLVGMLGTLRSQASTELAVAQSRRATVLLFATAGAATLSVAMLSEDAGLLATLTSVLTAVGAIASLMAFDNACLAVEESLGSGEAQAALA